MPFVSYTRNSGRQIGGRTGPPGPPGPGADVTAAEIEVVRDDALAARDAALAAAEVAEAGARSAVETVTRATLTGGQTYTIDPLGAGTFILTLTGNATLAIGTGLVDGQSFTVRVVQDPTGGRTLTLPTAAGSVTLTTTANTYETLVYQYLAGLGLTVHQVTGGAVAVPWTPNLMLNKVGWWDAATIAGDSGDNISFWENLWDELDLIVPASHTTPNLAVVNGHNVLSFDGVADAIMTGTGVTGSRWAASTISQPMTYAMVVKAVSGSSATHIPILAQSIGADSALAHYIYVDATATGFWTVNAGTKYVSSTANTPGSWMTVMFVVNGASTAAKVNATTSTAGNGGTQASAGLRIGKNGASAIKANMQIAQLIVVNHASDSTELAKLSTYLNPLRDALNGV